jgi:hypothetical protein
MTNYSVKIINGLMNDTPMIKKIELIHNQINILTIAKQEINYSYGTFFGYIHKNRDQQWRNMKKLLFEDNAKIINSEEIEKFTILISNCENAEYSKNLEKLRNEEVEFQKYLNEFIIIKKEELEKINRDYSNKIMSFVNYYNKLMNSIISEE